MKDKTTALILSIFVGGFGIDRFYLGYTGLGMLKLFTGGCFGILWLIDVINIAVGNLLPADGTPYVDGGHTSAYNSNKSMALNAAEELKKYKELFDQGIISEEEYLKKKDQLLSVI